MNLRWRRGRYVSKYHLGKRLGRGHTTVVFQARDTIQDIQVALKLPTSLDGQTLSDLRREIYAASHLDHPNVLAIRNADYDKDVLVVAYELGIGSLADRLDHRMSVRNCLRAAEHVIAGVAHAHEHGFMHCDIKPDNVICFPNNVFKLGDFDMAKRGSKTRKTSEPGGTMGYMAPELAMGYPSPRSDVFSTAILIYEVFTRTRPEYPFDWPPRGFEALRRKAPELSDVLRKALQPTADARFKDGAAMLRAFQKAQKKVLRRLDRSR